MPTSISDFLELDLNVQFTNTKKKKMMNRRCTTKNETDEKHVRVNYIFFAVFVKSNYLSAFEMQFLALQQSKNRMT